MGDVEGADVGDAGPLQVLCKGPFAAGVVAKSQEPGDEPGSSEPEPEANTTKQSIVTIANVEHNDVASLLVICDSSCDECNALRIYFA